MKGDFISGLFSCVFYIAGRIVKATEYCTATENGIFYHVKGKYGGYTCNIMDAKKEVAEKEFIQAIREYLRGEK